MICKHCSKEFESKRSTAKFCSVRCKLAYHRDGVSVSRVSVPDTLTDLSVSKVKHDKFLTDLVALRHAICEGKQVEIPVPMQAGIKEICKLATSKQSSTEHIQDASTKAHVFNALWLAYDCRSPMCVLR